MIRNPDFDRPLLQKSEDVSLFCDVDVCTLPTPQRNGSAASSKTCALRFIHRCREGGYIPLRIEPTIPPTTPPSTARSPRSLGRYS
jgi:hypothetical protein